MDCSEEVGRLYRMRWSGGSAVLTRDWFLAKLEVVIGEVKSVALSSVYGDPWHLRQR